MCYNIGTVKNTNKTKERKNTMKIVTVDVEIKKALEKKGYKWNKMEIKRFMGNDPYKFEVKLDGKLVEIYDCKKEAFFD